MTEPRDLTDLVPADVRTELAAAVTALELHGPAVTKVLRRLDRATTAAWNAVNPVDPTEDEWRLVERAVGIDRGWNAAYQLVPFSTRPGRAAHHLTPDGSQLLFLVLRVRLGRAKHNHPAVPALRRSASTRHPSRLPATVPRPLRAASRRQGP